MLIENGRIREIRTDGSAPAAGGDTEIDLRGAYLMPGLWDVHIHPDYYLPADMSLADQVTLFGHRMMAALTESGIASWGSPQEIYFNPALLFAADFVGRSSLLDAEVIEVSDTLLILLADGTRCRVPHAGGSLGTGGS